ncbi:MAG: OmpA family protein [Candidatus Lokiarchaeota archaeon]|nr:OmpA family protein [Candidatus Lokiarchaeota archaeon]
MDSQSFSLWSGITIPFTDYNETRAGFICKGSVSHYFNTYSNQFVSIKAFGGMGYLKGKDEQKDPTEFNTAISFFGTGINYGYRIEEKFFPSFFVGLSYLHFDPMEERGNKLPNNQAGVYSNNDVNLNFDVELQYLVSDQMTINLNTGIVLNFNDWLDDIETGKSNDTYYSLMLGISFFFMADDDADNDGIGNSIDLCPDTEEGIKVDQFGCPIDSDRDNIPDYIDRCPNTPSGVVVDSDGCPVDSDLDGIPDYWDRCPNTPQGTEVNKFGCPIDSDFDGVPDFLDQCPKTPYGAKVDKNGCPLDSDGDGVFDYLDKCPNTDKGEVVDSSGCTPIPERLVLSTSTFFNSNQAVLLPPAFPELDRIVEMIKKNPTINWRIDGHTDNTGNKYENKLLSLRRAQAVFNYFIANDIDKSKFEIIGSGQDFPIADNNTSVGRERNRRVEIIRQN